MSSQWKKRRTTLAMAVVVALYGTLAVSDDSAAQESQPGDSSTAKTLPKVRVEADETGYTVPSVTSATKTDTPLRDVPQAVSVITREQVQDQAMQSLADVIRYAQIGRAHV